MSRACKRFTVPLGGLEYYKFALNRGFYVGVNDGRILRYKGSRAGWVALPTHIQIAN
ncbi:hypothetical protein LguiA_018660 [Lonicera macranthoides]